MCFSNADAFVQKGLEVRGGGGGRGGGCVGGGKGERRGGAASYCTAGECREPLEEWGPSIL